MRVAHSSWLGLVCFMWKLLLFWLFFACCPFFLNWGKGIRTWDLITRWNVCLPLCYAYDHLHIVLRLCGFTGAKQSVYSKEWRDFGCFYTRFSYILLLDYTKGHILWPCSILSHVFIHGRCHGGYRSAHTCCNKGGKSRFDLSILLQ